MTKDDTSGKRIRLWRREVEREERESGGEIANSDMELGAALVKIADLARIDAASKRAASDAGIEASEIEEFCRCKREAFYRCEKKVILTLYQGFKVKTTRPYQAKAIKNLDKYQEAVAKLRELDDDFDLENREVAAMHAHGLVQGESAARLAGLARGGKNFLDELGAGIERAKNLVRKHYNVTGRAYTARDAAVDMFVYQLVFYIGEFGGNIRVSRRHVVPKRPNILLSIVDMLKLLKGFLPPAFPLNNIVRKCEKIGPLALADGRAATRECHRKSAT